MRCKVANKVCMGQACCGISLGTKLADASGSSLMRVTHDRLSCAQIIFIR